MLEKIRQVNNPLTIIAVFAGLAEISGTVVLPMLSLEVQHIYVWFLIVFPLLLVVLFFVTLNFNHKVLYAPSDYRSDEGFFRTIRTLTPEEKQLKLEREVEQIIPGGTFKGPDRVHFLELYREADELVRRDLKQQYGQSVQWDVFFRDRGGNSRELAGLITLPGNQIAIDIKVFTQPFFTPQIIEELSAISQLVGRVLLVAVTIFDESELKNFEQQLNDAIKARELPVDLSVHSLSELREKVI